MTLKKRWILFEAEKKKLEKQNLSSKEYEKAVQELCRKYRI